MIDRYHILCAIASGANQVTLLASRFSMNKRTVQKLLKEMVADKTLIRSNRRSGDKTYYIIKEYPNDEDDYNG